jgi:hypothetical protein
MTINWNVSACSDVTPSAANCLQTKLFDAVCKLLSSLSLSLETESELKDSKFLSDSLSASGLVACVSVT